MGYLEDMAINFGAVLTAGHEIVGQGPDPASKGTRRKNRPSPPPLGYSSTRRPAHPRNDPPGYMLPDQLGLSDG